MKKKPEVYKRPHVGCRIDLKVNAERKFRLLKAIRRQIIVAIVSYYSSIVKHLKNLNIAAHGKHTGQLVLSIENKDE